MTKEIARVFYDKTVHILTSKVNIDTEGGVNKKGYEVVGDFKCNVNFSNCKEIQEEYGLDYNIDVTISTSKDTVIKIDDIISYDNIVFNTKNRVHRTLSTCNCFLKVLKYEFF